MSTKQPRKKRTRKKPVVADLPEDLLSSQYFTGKVTYKLKNVYHTRLIIQDAPSGSRYDFLPGAVLEVDQQDYEFLLAKERKQDQAVCCGGARPNFPYFEGV